MGWKFVADKLDGLASVKHAVLTVGGTWEVAPGTQYPSNVVAGVNMFVNEDLVYEVPVPYPASFGPIGGPINSDSYAQSVAVAVTWIQAWIIANPLQTFALAGYSQGGEVVARVVMWLQGAGGAPFLTNFIGGYTFGNPCRGAGFHAPTIADPGGHGISPDLMTELPTINGQVVWADYVHSKANGDAADDMYACVPNGQIGVVMGDVYTLATQAQVNDFASFIQSMVTDLMKTISDSGILPAFAGGLTGLLTLGVTALIQFLVGLIGGASDANATGVTADVDAAVLGLDFLAAPGGPTAPHISYNGELGGYSNLVGDAIGFLANIATLTPARSA